MRILNLNIMNLINEGGPFFMVSLLILLLISIFFLIKSFKDNSEKNTKLLKAISLFALVFGFFGFMLGLVNALDAIESLNGSTNPSILSGGFKRSILPPLLGALTFLVGRLGVIILLWIKK